MEMSVSQYELFSVVKEIMALQRERRELLASLTPGLSIWKRREETLFSRFAGTDYTAAAPVQVPVQEMDTESASASEQLGRYLDSISQDIEDLSHRMLSTTYLVVKSDGAALSSYMTDELVSSTSRLMDACKELHCRDTEDNDEQQAEELEVQNNNAFLDFYQEFLEEPSNYQNELALVFTKDEEEDWGNAVEKEKKRAEEALKENMAKMKRWKEKQKETVKYLKEKKMSKESRSEFMENYEKERQEEKEKYEKERQEEEQEEYEKDNPHPDTMEYINKGIEFSMHSLAGHRDGWNIVRGSKSAECGEFRDITTLSPMHFTHYTPDTIRSSCGVTGSTLQIYTIEILELKKGLKWPLKLYGLVSARDTVDRNRNIVFYRSSSNCQELTENGCLCLTGPSRAIVALDYVDFEVELRIKEGNKSQDKELITLSKRYDGTSTSLMLEGILCKAVLRLEQLSRAVQATIVGVCVVEGKWPFKYGCRVACSLGVAAAGEVVLLDCHIGDGEVHVGSNDYLHLSRNVVSVQSQGTLRVVIRSYLKSGRAARNWKFDFPAQQCQTSECECSVGTTKVKVVVAWSLLVKEKRDLLVDCAPIKIQRETGSLKKENDSEETPLAKLGGEIPMLKDRGLLDALCRHREILTRETDFLQGEVTSRGFETFAGKKAYMETQSNRRTILPPLLCELFASRRIQLVGVNLPHLVTNPQQSLVLLLHESHNLRYRIQSLVSILREFGIPASFVDGKARMLLFLMSRATVIISETMRCSCSKEGARRLHQTHWESIWCSGRAKHGVFEDITTLSPMVFTSSTPGIPPYSAIICPALQIYSFKIVLIHPNLNWPLRVYGIVAARDTVDHNRNLLFYRSRSNYQIVTEEDPCLRLTGPSRAIVADKPVTFEVELQIKYPGAEERQDTIVFSRTYTWRSMLDTTPLIRGYACEAELRLEALPRAIQGTIVGVRLVAGSWPSTYGCRVSCSLSSAAEEAREIELLNCSSLDDIKKSPVGSDGYFGLARNVVSAELQSTLTVVIQAIGGPHNHVEFHVEQYCQTSRASCFVVGCEVEVVVAWSLLVQEKF